MIRRRGLHFHACVQLCVEEYIRPYSPCRFPGFPPTYFEESYELAMPAGGGKIPGASASAYVAFYRPDLIDNESRSIFGATCAFALRSMGGLEMVRTHHRFFSGGNTWPAWITRLLPMPRLLCDPGTPNQTKTNRSSAVPSCQICEDTLRYALSACLLGCFSSPFAGLFVYCFGPVGVLLFFLALCFCFLCLLPRWLT